MVLAPAVLLILVPLVAGSLISGSIPLMEAWSGNYLLWSMVFLVFWFWVGMRFAGLNAKKTVSLALGNSLTVFFFVVCLIFAASPAAYPRATLWHWSQMYALLVVPLSSRMLIFCRTITSASILVTSYLLMAVTFTAGFYLRHHRSTG